MKEWRIGKRAREVGIIHLSADPSLRSGSHSVLRMSSYLCTISSVNTVPD